LSSFGLQNTLSKNREREREHDNEMNIAHSYSLKDSADKTQEMDLISKASHVSAAEYLSGESGESYDDDDDDFRSHNAHEEQSPDNIDSKIMLGLTKSSQVMSVLEDHRPFNLKAS
jgi:hypothetical protein